MRSMARTWATLVMAIAATRAWGASYTAIDLRCEQMRGPLGVDVEKPRLSWKLRAEDTAAHGLMESAYEVMVASSAEKLEKGDADLWDSGKVVAEGKSEAVYAGKMIGTMREAFWKVRSWDQADQPSAWSEPARWTMGVMNAAEWKAKWIGAAEKTETVLLRGEIAVRPGLRRAVAAVCGLGQYEMSVNGKKVGDALLTPGWTNYKKTCLYDEMDVTAMLHEGNNALGMILGNGMYNVAKNGRYTKFVGTFGALKAIAQVRLEYADGTVEVVGTDERWRTSAGPITLSSIYGGEDEDARLEKKGWDEPDFNASAWPAAAVVEGPSGVLRGQSCAAPAIRAFEVFQPGKRTTLASGAEVIDFGQNASQMPRITAHGAAGAMVRLIPGETLNAKTGAAEQGPGGGPSYWQYTLRGEGSETWFPKFFYRGYRYLQVERTAATNGELPVVDAVESVVVHADAEPVGTFECSNELFNRIHTLVRWAQRSNMVSVLTDCPHREKLGWLEEDHLNGPALRYEFDLGRLFGKIENDMADSQLADGLVPNIAPEYTVFGPEATNAFRNSPEWGSAFLLVPWQQYEFTGDVELFRAHYEKMKRYVGYLESRAAGGIVNYGLGDWYDIGPKRPGVAQLTPKALTATAFYFADTEILGKVAGLLGKKEDAAEYAKKAAAIKQAFNEKFFDAGKEQYATGSQCANAIPLVMGLVEDAHRAAVLQAIVKDVQAHGNAFTAGDVGYRYLLRALADGGRSDVIFEMNNQSDKPGYGYQLKMGATSLTEAWNADPRSSQNHFMLGQIMEWFYHDLAGIQSDGAGFRKIIIKPAMVGTMAWAKGSYMCPAGKIVSEWRREGEAMRMDVEIPVNTTAIVWIPAKEETEVTEDGKKVGTVAGIKVLGGVGLFVQVEVGSGKWRFGGRMETRE